MLTLTYITERDRATGWRYLWCKHVVAFRSGAHCAQCLSGSYVEAVSPRLRVNEGIKLGGYRPGDILYLCGVSSPYRWERNLHLAVRVDPGAMSCVAAYNGDGITIEGAYAIKFDDEAARRLFPNKGREFLTCRNFQFGAQEFAGREQQRTS